MEKSKHPISIICKSNNFESILSSVQNYFREHSTDCGTYSYNDEGVYAGVEAFIPTIFIVSISTVYFGSIAKEAGKDHYHILKKGITKLFKKSKSVNYTLVGTTGKLNTNYSYSLIHSIEAGTPSGVIIKLLISNSTEVAHASEQVDVFISFVDRLHSDKLTNIEIEKIDKSKVIGNKLITVVDLQSKTVEFPDPFFRNQGRS